MARRVAIVAILLVPLIVGAVAALRWARAPLERQRFLMDVPLVLREGERASGTFTPEHDGVFGLCIRIERAGTTDELGSWIGGGWFGHGQPPGFAVTYAIRSEGQVVKSGTVTEFPWGSAGPSEYTVSLVSVAEGTVQPYEAEIRVDRARAELGGLTTSFAAEDKTDWTGYASLTASLRTAFVVLALGAVVVVAGVAFLIVWVTRSRARAASAAPGRPDPVEADDAAGSTRT